MTMLSSLFSKSNKQKRTPNDRNDKIARSNTEVRKIKNHSSCRGYDDYVHPVYVLPPLGPQRSMRYSSDVFLDEPTAISAGGDAHGRSIRVSQLEDRVRDLEILNESICSTTSRQNLMFGESKSDTQRQMCQELIDKSIFIGQLESRLRSMAAEMERKQIELEEANAQLQKEKDVSQDKCLSMREKITTLTEKLNACERISEDKSEKQLMIVNEQLKLRSSELAVVKNQAKKKEEEERRLQSRIRELEKSIVGLKKVAETAGKSACTDPSKHTEPVDAKALPLAFENLLRKHYHRTMSCHSLAIGLSQATSYILDGNDSHAVKALGFISDSEGEDSDAFVSDDPDACKMNLAMAERLLRKECDLLDRTEKKLTDVRKGYLGILGKEKDGGSNSSSNNVLASPR